MSPIVVAERYAAGIGALAGRLMSSTELWQASLMALEGDWNIVGGVWSAWAGGLNGKEFWLDSIGSSSGWAYAAWGYGFSEGGHFGLDEESENDARSCVARVMAVVVFDKGEVVLKTRAFPGVHSED